VKELEKKCVVFSHLTDCLAICLRNPFTTIPARGMNIEYFGKHVDTCQVAEDRHFIEKYGAKMETRPLPVPYDEVVR